MKYLMLAGILSMAVTVWPQALGKPSARLIDAPHIPAPAPTDCNSPAFWDGDTVYLFSSVGRPRRSSGPSLAQLGNTLRCVWDAPRDKSWWIESVWREPESGILYGWYHHEPSGLVPGTAETAPKIGAVISYDNGLTWKDQGFVLENGYPIVPEWDNGYFVGGNGDFCVILDEEKKYFYFLFSNYGGPIAEQGIGIARSKFSDRGQPGTVFKYYQGKWLEPGLGGKVTPIMGTKVGWAGPDLDCRWGPSVHWNTYLKCYVMVLNRALRHGWKGDAIEIAYSKDLLRWSRPEPIYTQRDVGWYPSILGFHRGETDTRCGRFGRFYIFGQSHWVIQFFRPAEAQQKPIAKRE